VIASLSVTDNTGKSVLSDNKQTMEEKKERKSQAFVEVTDFGPLKITGNLIVKDIKRDKEELVKEIWLCRCGKSGNKPYCDDSHAK
jgi:CDGSH iron-sulfur domain-containing protein 3